MKRPLGNVIRATGVTSNSSSTSGVFHSSEILELRENIELAGINRNVQFLENKGGILDWVDLSDDPNSFTLDDDGSMKLKSDGTRLYIISTAGIGSIVQFDLTEAWNLKTLTNPYFFHLYPETACRAMCFSNDGRYLYIHGTTIDDLVQYELTRYWDLAGGLTEVNRIDNWSTTAVTDMHINNDGTRFFALFSTARNDTYGYETYPILQFNIETPFDITTMSSGNGSNLWDTDYDETLNTDQGIKYHFAFVEEEKKLFLSSDYDQAESVREFRLSNTYSLSTAKYYANTTISLPDPISYTVNKHGLQFGANGQYLYNISDAESINRYDLSTPYDPSSITANTITVDGTLLFSTFGAGAGGAEWKPDGTSIIIQSPQNSQNEATVIRYDLDTAWDVTTAKFSGKVFNTYPYTQYLSYDIRIGDSGTKMYVIQDYEDTVGQFTLQTAWDPSTATFDGYFTGVRDYETAPRCMAWKPDGTKFYLYGTTGDNITEWDVSTPWDLTGTVTYSGESGGIFTSLYSIEWNDDGTLITGATTSSDRLYYYSVGTAYDITTLNTSGSLLAIGTLDTTPYGFRWMDSGNQALIMGGQYDPNIVSATVGTAYDPSTIDTASANKNISDVADDNIGFYVSPDGHFLAFTTIDDDRVFAYTTSSNGVFNTSTVNGSQELDVSGSLTGQYHTGIFFKPDGTKMYLMEYAQDLHQYTLSTPWDITTATYDSVTYDMDGQGADVDTTRGIWFRDDGLKIFSIGLDNKIKSHTLTSAWDLTTASVDAAEINLIDLNWNAIYLSDDGTRVYFGDADFSPVHQFNLDTPWDLSSFNNTGGQFTPSHERALNCGGISFSSDGSKLYYMHTRRNNGGHATFDANRLITIYLDTPWEINTADFLRGVQVSFAPHAINTNATHGLDIDDDGNMHILDHATGGSQFPRITVLSDKQRAYGDGPTGYDLISPTGYGLHEYTRWVKTVDFDHWARISYGFCYGDSGTKLYMLCSYYGYIHQFDLSTAYDPASATHSNKMFVVDGNNLGITSYNRHVWYDIKWSHDGQYCFVLDQYDDIIWQLEAQTAWDVSTLVYNSSYTDFQGDALADVNGYLDVTAQETGPTGFTFNHDGSLLYVLGTTDDDINTYRINDPDGVVGEPYIIGCADPAGNGTNNRFANSMPLEGNIYNPRKIVFNQDFSRYYVMNDLDIFKIGPVVPEEGIKFTGTGNNHVIQDSTSPTVSWAYSLSSGIYNRLLHISEDLTYLGLFYPDGGYDHGGGWVMTFGAGDTLLDKLDSSGTTILRFEGTSTSYDRNVPTCMFFKGVLGSSTYTWYGSGGNNSGTQNTTAQWWQNNNANQLQQGNMTGGTTNGYIITHSITFPDEITGVTFSRDGKNVFLAFLNGAIGQWEVPTAWDISSIVTPGSWSGAVATFDTAYGTAAGDGLGDIEISDDGGTLFALNHFDSYGSVIEVFKLDTANDLRSIVKTGKLITGPHTHSGVNDQPPKLLSNSLCFREGYLFFLPHEMYDGSAWQNNLFVVDFNQPFGPRVEENLPATLMNANSVPATTLVTQGNTYTYSLYVDDPEGATGTWTYEIVSGNGTVGTNADANFVDINNVGNGTFEITGTSNASFLVTQSANVIFRVDVGEILTVPTLLRGFDYPASITGSSITANTDLLPDRTYTYNFNVDDPEGETGTNWQYNILDGNITIGSDPNSNFFLSANNVGNGTFIFTTSSNLEIMNANSTNDFQSSNISFTVDLTNESLTLGPSTFKGTDTSIGGAYAAQYTAITGGTVVIHGSTSGSIDSAIDGLTNGDALLLDPGTYTLTGGTDAFRSKNILICGNDPVGDAGEVVIEHNHDLPSSVRDHPIFNIVSTDLSQQMAFLSYKRIQTSGTNYISAVVKGFGDVKGKMVNCYLDLNNGDISWLYDNNNDPDIDVRFHNCTFANYGNWDSKYSGRTDVVHVYNPLMDDGYDTNDVQFYGTVTSSATVDTVNRTYNINTYPNSGHLLIDLNYLDHANTA